MRRKPVHMYLVQKPASRNPSEAEKEAMYQALKARAIARSEDNYINRGVKPILLRLNMKGTIFDTTIEMLVRYGSFEIISGGTAENKGKEIGFKLVLKSFLTEEEHTLVVWRCSHKAYIEVYSLDGYSMLRNVLKSPTGLFKSKGSMILLKLTIFYLYIY